MTELKHLENISLFDNQFSGVIPQSLGINSSLVRLDLMNNKFTGILPPHLCFGKQLHVLNMGFNQLQGAIPADAGTCPSLKRLTLNQNNFIGPLPLFQNNPSLQYMDLSNNNISGEIPSSLGKCTNVTDVNLSMNKFTGLIPQELGKLVNVRILNLAHNNLVGPLPSQLSNCNKMDSFDVGFNFLNGSFPSSLKSWTGITTLILRENHFTGSIPPFLSEFGMLLELQLGGNLFGGKIPESIGNLQNLMYGLNLSSNGLIGEVPLSFSSLDKLVNLDLSHNNLTGDVRFVAKLPSLVMVNISYNFFYGPVPKILLNSAPISSLGNPGLLFCCPGSACTSETSYMKPCSDKSTDHKGTKRIVLIVMIGFASLIFVALLLARLVKISVGDAQENEIHDDAGVSLMKEVMEATENLDDRYIIGRGAHGVVYKASLDPYRVFAVKKVQYGENKGKLLSMRREIQTIGLIRHRNLIRFQNSWSGKDYGLVFYEYMENGSLHDVLHVKKPAPALEWNVRYKIAV
ncbi:hypothetical protein L6164_002381 [Bauhinia variegata]|uniref:Uncharacterized protein n=1 Tax=Bauhinia variegata TaxID=167791 RepID=A0ACB9PYJ2_BAUVA|nr:hypothetical protein L6164_002381 [Bauhinia variegata]